jgi:hypothetical protein
MDQMDQTWIKRNQTQIKQKSMFLTAIKPHLKEIKHN